MRSTCLRARGPMSTTPATSAPCRSAPARPVPGVNGSYSLENERQSGLAYPDMTPDPSLSQAHLVLQVQDGRHRILSPAPYVEAGFRFPSWWATERASA